MVANSVSAVVRKPSKVLASASAERMESCGQAVSIDHLGEAALANEKTALGLMAGTGATLAIGATSSAIWPRSLPVVVFPVACLVMGSISLRHADRPFSGDPA